MKRNKVKCGHFGRRRGAALVEFAVVAPVMILFCMGLIDLGRMAMVKQMLINASREGARQATLLDANSNTVVSEVAASLAKSGINASVSTVPSDLAQAVPGTQVKVTVCVPANAVSWTGFSTFMSGATLTASTTMRRESL